MSTTGSKAGTRITLVANTYTDITTEFEALGDSVVISCDMANWEIGLVTSGQTPTALADIDEAGSVLVTKGNESALDVWAYALLAGDIWLVPANKHAVVDVTGTTSS